MGVRIMEVAIMGVTIMGVTIMGVTIRGNGSKDPPPSPSLRHPHTDSSGVWLERSNVLWFFHFLRPWPLSSFACT